MSLSIFGSGGDDSIVATLWYAQSADYGEPPRRQSGWSDWKARNPKRVAELRRAREAQNVERVRESRRAWKRANRDKVIEQKRRARARKAAS
jgi:hypothetical protein